MFLLVMVGIVVMVTVAVAIYCLVYRPAGNAAAAQGLLVRWEQRLAEARMQRATRTQSSRF